MIALVIFFSIGSATRVPGHKNFVPSECYPLSSYPPYAHGAMYAVSRDVMSYVARNGEDFARGTINRCIEKHCEKVGDCGNKRGSMPSLEDVQVLFSPYTAF